MGYPILKLLAILISGSASLSAPVPALSQQGAVPEWNLVPDLEVGSSADPGLGLVAGIAVAGNGTIYVLDRQPTRILAFDRAGKFIRQIGRTGRGPGEYQRPVAIGLHADTLWVADPGLLRLTRFAPDGSVLSTSELQSPIADELYNGALVGGFFRDGSYLVAPRISNPAAFVRRRTNGGVRVPLIRLSQSGEKLSTFDQAVRVSLPFVLLHEGRTLAGPNPFHNEDFWRVAPGGDHLIIVEHEPPVSGDAARTTIQKISADGTTIYSRTYRTGAVPVSSEELDDAVAANLSQSPSGGSDRGVARELRDALAEQRFHAPVEEVALGNDGTVWIKFTTRTSPQGNARWHVFDLQGMREAAVEAPDGVRILAADSEFAWGVLHDEFDVPTVVRLRIDRASKDASSVM